VVYLTAYADEETLRRARITEPFGYVLKPFEERELRSVIEMALYKHQAERRLQESERRYAITLSSIGDAVIATDPAARVTFMNPVAEVQTGWPRAEANGRPLGEVFHILNEKTRQPVENPAAKVLRLGVVVGLANDTVLLSRDGRELPIADCGAPIIDDQGQIAGVVVVFHDVLERRLTEMALRESEERFRSVFKTALTGMAITDLKGRFLQVNRSYERLFGYAAAELQQTSFFDLTHPEDRPYNHQVVEDLLTARCEACHFEERCLRKDGTPIWTHTTYSTIKDGAGKPRFLVSMVQDITERKRAEAEREELHRLVLASRQQLKVLSRRLIQVQEEERRRLARELHDELGQVLTAVNLNIEAIRQTADEATQARLGESMLAIDRAIEQVRSLSLDLRPAMLDIMGLESALHWYIDRHVKAGGPEVELVSTLAGQRYAPEWETTCFRVVQEALTNVGRHAQARHVRIELSGGEGALHLTIQDDGIGFDVAAAQVRASQGGTFGLLGIQERVQLLGGQIDIESAPGRGTRVQVQLPTG
jgi:PAS domain S-box-containing protein